MPLTMPLDARAIGAAVPPMPAFLDRARAALKHGASRLLHLRVRCLLVGHEDTFRREPHRLFLRCAVCGRATRGWQVGRASGPGATGPTLEPARAVRVPLEAPAGRTWATWRAAGVLREGRRMAAAALAAESRARGTEPAGATRRGGPPPVPVSLAASHLPTAARLRDAGRGDYSRGSGGGANGSPAKPHVRIVRSAG
jgi:hypothetical protein